MTPGQTGWVDVLHVLMAQTMLPVGGRPNEGGVTAIEAILSVLDEFVASLNETSWLYAVLLADTPNDEPEVHNLTLMVAPKSRYDTLVAMENFRIETTRPCFLQQQAVVYSPAHLAARFLLDVAPGGKYARLREEFELLEAESIAIEPTQSQPVAPRISIQPAERRRCIEQFRATPPGEVRVPIEGVILSGTIPPPGDLPLVFRGFLARVHLEVEVVSTCGDKASLLVRNVSRGPMHLAARCDSAADLLKSGQAPQAAPHPD
jgi:hypothetical protein